MNFEIQKLNGEIKESNAWEWVTTKSVGFAQRKFNKDAENTSGIFH